MAPNYGWKMLETAISISIVRKIVLLTGGWVSQKNANCFLCGISLVSCHVATFGLAITEQKVLRHNVCFLQSFF